MREHRPQDGQLRATQQLAQDALAVLGELQDAFVEQTKKYGELARSVREQQKDFGRDLLEAGAMGVACGSRVWPG